MYPWSLKQKCIQVVKNLKKEEVVFKTLKVLIFVVYHLLHGQKQIYWVGLLFYYKSFQPLIVSTGQRKKYLHFGINLWETSYFLLGGTNTSHLLASQSEYAVCQGLMTLYVRKKGYDNLL